MCRAAFVCVCVGGGVTVFYGKSSGIYSGVRSWLELPCTGFYCAPL